MSLRDIGPSDLLGDDYIDIPADVYGLGERIRKGDATMGWRGDESMGIYWNPRFGEFEVLGLDAERKVYCVWHGRKLDGPAILAHLVATDWQKGRRLLDELHAKRKAKDEQWERDTRDKRMEANDKLRFALNKVFRHYGDGGRRVFGQIGRGSA